jgi:hypothetical protein
VLPQNIAFLADRLKSAFPRSASAFATGRAAGWSSYGCASIWAARSSHGDLGTATQFPHTIQWDPEVKPEWIGKADFIYSNSFDIPLIPLCASTAG